jgi:hypothetical protein
VIRNTTSASSILPRHNLDKNQASLFDSLVTGSAGPERGNNGFGPGRPDTGKHTVMLQFLRGTHALRRVRRVLGAVEFSCVDIGPLNDALDVDCFVVSPPKCGTTTLQRGLDRAGQKVIHCHTDVSTFAAFPNGEVLRENRLGMATILRARVAAKPKRRVYIFFGYREPVSWYLSLAGEFRLPLDSALKDGILPNIHSSYPWNLYATDEINDLIADGVGLSPWDQTFDPKKGYAVSSNARATLITYRIDHLEAVAQYIRAEIAPGFVDRFERQNIDPAYNAYASNLVLPRQTLETLYDDRWFRRFYSDAERAALIAAYQDRAAA